MILVSTKQHVWVKHTITPVSVVPDIEDDRQIVVVEDPRDTEQAEDDAVYGCDRCGKSMPGNTDSLCEGEPQDG